MSCESSVNELLMDPVEDESHEQLLPHIAELQDAVGLMREAFQAAQLQLLTVQEDDRTLREEIDTSKVQCQQQSSEIVRLILSLKSEITSLKEILQNTQFIQHGLQSTVNSLIVERDFLLDALAKTGAISSATRERLHSRVTGFGRPSSGSQSTNDSGVAMLLDKTHANFANNGLVSNGQFDDMLYRDHDSLQAGCPAHIVSPQHIQEYLNGLSSNMHNNDGDVSGGYTSFNTETNGGVLYDSDSSLTVAATKSLSLSNSLGKQCGLELDHHDEDKERTQMLTMNGDDEMTDAESPPPPIQVGSGTTRFKVRLPVPSQDDAQEHQHQEGRFFSGNLEENDVNGKRRTCSTDSGSLVKDQPEFKENQRLRVATEMVETERKYCNTLHTIQHTFAQPLKTSGILTVRDINTLFPEEVCCLYEKHCDLLKKLEERVGSWKSQPTIGDLLEEFTNPEGSDVLRLYTSYVNDFPEVLKTFHKLCRNSGAFTRFIKSCLEHPTCGGLDLGAFLLTPVQRMPRYILLLKQMLKYTESSHPDYKNISQCLDRLREYLKRLNDSMENSYMLVTAQISPESSRNGFCSSQQSRFQRASISSSQSSSGDATEVVHQVRYRRSTSVPRNPKDGCQGKEGKVKLKSRSKSEWTVCNGVRKRCPQEDGGSFHACVCDPQSSPSSYASGQGSCGKSSKTKTSARYTTTSLNNHDSALERTLSDSDINSETEEGSSEPKFTASKSLHDFNQHGQDSGFEWTKREAGLCSSKSTKVLSLQQRQTLPCSAFTPDSTLRKNLLVRPFGGQAPGNYVARIQRGSEPELNSLPPNMSVNGKDGTKKRTSLRTSLKNIFSLRKRYSGSRGESTSTSNYYRVVYAEKSCTEAGSGALCTQHATNCTASTTTPTPHDHDIALNIHRAKRYVTYVVPSTRGARTLEISHPIPTASGRTSVSSFSKTDNFCSSPVVMTNYEPAPSPDHYFIPGSVIKNHTTSTTPGAHFLDEDGKPCTNV